MTKKKYVNVSAVSRELTGDPNKIRANKMTKDQSIIINTCNEAIQHILNKFKKVLK